MGDYFSVSKTNSTLIAYYFQLILQYTNTGHYIVINVP